MKETVDRILKTEEAARQRVERAHQESLDIVRRSRQEAAELLEQAVSSARLAAEARKNEAEKGFFREKEKELKETQDKISAQRIEKEKDISKISQRIFLEIIQIND